MDKRRMLTFTISVIYIAVLILFVLFGVGEKELQQLDYIINLPLRNNSQ